MKKIMMFCLAALLLVAFTAPAMAATNKATFYGNVRMWQYIEKRDKDLTGFGESDTDLIWDMDSGNTRFGIKLNEGKIKANLEVRPVTASYFRQFWASYAFTDNVEMIFGFTWSPFFCPVTKFAWTGGAIEGIWGDMVACLRSTQVGFKLKFPFGRAHIALEPPNTSAKISGSALSGFTANDTDTFMPRIEANFTFALGPANLGVFGGVNKYKVWNQSSDDKETITCYMYGVRVEVPVGPLSLRGLYYQGQNEENYGYAFGPSGYAYNPLYAEAQFVNNKVEDSTTKGYALAVGYKVNDMFSVDVGYGYAKYEGYQQQEDPGAFYYIAFPITIAKGFTVQPEVGVLDLKDYTPAGGQVAGTDYDQGKITVYGLYWMINF